ncbi:MAG: L,D-transpeptidase [Chloroflexi bacterium]|nr:L,D-transpeptidase [Chloroflexota bacterium]
MRATTRPAVIALAAIVIACVLAAGCETGSDVRKAGVTIEPLASATAQANNTPRIGGKPATPPTAPPASTAEPEAPTDVAAMTEPPATVEVVPAEGGPTEPPTPRASDGSTAPDSGRWIDVDVSTFAVRLMDGATVVREITSVGVGAQVDTGEYASTQTGLFYVNSKVEELAYDPPYDTYISHWVGFDLDKANGFHSFLKDANGAVVDPSTGRVSNGCIRTGEAEAVYAYAEIGMPVWVHW